MKLALARVEARLKGFIELMVGHMLVKSATAPSRILLKKGGLEISSSC